MGISKKQFADYVKNFDFRQMFNDMGWNNDRTKQPVVVDNTTYHLTSLAEKSGFRILSCVPADNTIILPDKEVRKKIQRSVTKLFQEHIIIYFDDTKTSQIWQTPIRKPGFPTKTSEIVVTTGKDPEQLYQRAGALFFTLDEEDKITIVDVTKKVTENFQQNNETVTKKFYDGFKKEHTSFLKFIEGIADKTKIDWYASLMLNRLMFCYFIQKQRFLDDNMNYLQDKLKECKIKKGKNKFYSFYRDFLLSLFHKGLGAPNHSKELAIELGKIPYLNGGLFDVHVIERECTNIQIDDKAFEQLFDFFDQWNWHLDTRTEASGKDINPDVIGYIFEKYINDRAQMGAYYTKEDITDYISKNCIVPWLFDEVKRNSPKFFTPDGWLWQMVKNSGDGYIYDAVKYGVPEIKSGKSGSKSDQKALLSDLPQEILNGFNSELENKVVDGNGPWLWEQRKEWNKPAPSDIALPTEIYRGLIERRKRYLETKTKIERGEVHEINDFITLNLNIRQFAQDTLEDTDDPDFIREFYKALSSVTILDPTCGSGAFLFAAMNILEPLYETCIDKMESFVHSGKGKFKFFEDTLKHVEAPEHPNRKYFIFKSIILNNLYGVDIMNEAVEIAKLRLFLKLVATVDPDYKKDNLGLEPLPDVDFNIRAGNTLVGYATKKQIDDIAGMFVTQEHKDKILEQCDLVARAFERYKEIQLKGGEDYSQFKTAKDDLNYRLKRLTDDLDKVCYVDMYKGDEKIIQKDLSKVDKKIVSAFGNWRESHKPFHWFAEYYEIVSGNSGFDVVIGNPPYVEYSKIRETYSINAEYDNFLTNLYCVCSARALSIKTEHGYFSFIVPVSLPSTDRLAPLRNVLLKNGTVYHVSFSTRPSKLFDGAEQRLTVFIFVPSGKYLFTSGYNHWYKQERSFLFQKILFVEAFPYEGRSKLWPKYSPHLGDVVFTKMLTQAPFKNSDAAKGNALLYYKNTGLRYFSTVTLRPPKCWINGNATSSSRETILRCSESMRGFVHCLLLSSTFFYYYHCCSNCRDLNPSDIMEFPIPDIDKQCHIFEDLSVATENDYSSKSSIIRMQNKKTGLVELESVTPANSKPFIDRIDSQLAIHYGFTHAELDFIINYDIKYRMGKELDGGDEE